MSSCILAITGVHRSFHAYALFHLLRLPNIQQIHVFDTAPLLCLSPKLFYHCVDITADSSVQTIAKICLQHNINVFLHGALFSAPHQNPAYMHETESIGTYHVLTAIAQAKIPRLVVSGHTFVYGTQTKPIVWKEEDLWNKTAAKEPNIPFIKTRKDVEKQCEEFRENEPYCHITVLRFAPIIGAHVYSAYMDYFLHAIAPKTLQSDLNLQFIHEEDAFQALQIVLFGPPLPSPAYNIVGRGLISLTSALQITKQIALPCPQWMGANFAQRCCLANGQKAYTELPFFPKYSSRMALKSFLLSRRKEAQMFQVTSLLDEHYSATIGKHL